VPLIFLSVVRDVLEVRSELKVLAGLLIYGIGLLSIPVAAVEARRYQVSRTSWRGIHFPFRGRAIDFLKLFVKNPLLTGLTLGLYYPIYNTKHHAFLVSHSYFGNQAFDFNGKRRDLLKSYVLMLLLFPFTLGVSWFWFQAKRHRYFWDHTSVATARFHSTVTWGLLIRLHVVNLLLLLVTIGLGWPWVTIRNVKFTCKHVSLVRRNRAMLTLVAGLAVIAVAIALFLWGMPTPMAVLSVYIPISWEERLGEAVIKEVASPGKRCQDARRIQRIEQIVTTLTAPPLSSPYTFHVRVVNDRHVNAFAAPGGYIVLFRGLIQEEGNATFM
jgi:uncharacterized membrane protein YjgN (DUF898 family)